MRKVLWNGMKQTVENAQSLSDFYNQGLSLTDKTEVIMMTSNWFIIIGNDVAKKWVDEVNKHLESVKEDEASERKVKGY